MLSICRIWFKIPSGLRTGRPGVANKQRKKVGAGAHSHFQLKKMAGGHIHKLNYLKIKHKNKKGK